VEKNTVTQRGTLLEELARTRYIEQGPNGEIFILLEHILGAKIVKLVPE
jgi:uncharacterized protein YbcI